MIRSYLKPKGCLMAATLLIAFITSVSPAQSQSFDPAIPLVSRVNKTPDDALKMFRDAGMSPSEHVLTDQERALVTKAFELLPPLHQRILKDHLAGISFLDNMPNTALTSIMPSADTTVRRYHITFRAAILRQTVSDWLTEKERACFSPDDSTFNVSVQTGTINAIIYVLLHETTHVVDGSMNLFGNIQTGFAKEFTAGIWLDRVKMVTADTLLAKNRYRRGGKAYTYSQADSVYRALKQSSFASLYSTSSWSEDLAESLTIYHLTSKLHQPFKLTLLRKGKVLLSYEPGKNRRLQRKNRAISIFYDQI